MSSLKRKAWLLLAASITLQLVIIRSSHSLKHINHPIHHPSIDSSPPLNLLKRSHAHHLPNPSGQNTTTQSLLSLPYAEWYESASPTSKPLVITALISILAFLFSFIGISASDFFCPNLSTIAAYLGLNESTAGVTFLAFGNGSPDVFSTFSALKGGTFSLAIGELIGAATFIISIVVGTIALIKPFHVPRAAFLRDVIFFTMAVILVVTVLQDGRLAIYESGSMVVLYLLYVMVVVGGNWWSKRQSDKETARALGWTDRYSHPHSQPDDVEASSARVHSRRASGKSVVPSIHLAEPEEPLLDEMASGRSRASSVDHTSPMNSPSPAPQRMPLRRQASDTHTPRANFSLLGAIEFRDVVNSLKKESESRGTSPSKTPNEDGRQDYFGAVGASYAHRRSSSVATHGIGTLGRNAVVKGRQRSVSNVGPGKSAPMDLPHPGLSPLSNLSPVDSVATSLTPSSVSTIRPVFREPNPWQDQIGHPPSNVTTPDLLGPPSPALQRPERPRIDIPKRRRLSIPKIPSISITDPSGLPGAPSPPAEPPSTPAARNESRFRIRRRSRMALRILFPSLQSFRHKSYLGRFLAITAVPAILALTLTLPVVDDGRGDEGEIALPLDDHEGLGPQDGFDALDRHDEEADVEEDNRLLGPNVGEELHHLVEGGFSPLHSPLGRIHHSALLRMASQGSIHSGSEADDDEGEDLAISKEILEEIRQDEALDFHPVLTAAQCILGPAFCTYIICSDLAYFKWIMLGAVLGGTVAAIGTLIYATDGSSRTWRLVRCFAGFICSMVWIAAIADEVVSVLQALGEILGLSDAIIGLTIFAVGNSLADLVANVTVAQFAPAMAYAACFGGPMLNLLLGVGGSGTYHMLANPHQTPVSLHFSPTLWVSASGLVIILVTTAIVVPLNGYLIDRRWAICLIIAYGVLMCVNVAVEIKTGRD